MDVYVTPTDGSECNVTEIHDADASLRVAGLWRVFYVSVQALTMATSMRIGSGGTKGEGAAANVFLLHK